MALSPEDVARLVHHYLVQQGYETAADAFVTVCPHLTDLLRSDADAAGNRRRQSRRFIGPSLLDLLEEYFEVKDNIVEELEATKCRGYRPQDSLPTLSRALVADLKERSRASSAPTRDACVNTEETDDEPEDVDLGAVYCRLLEDSRLHEKIAENINKKCDPLLSAAASGGCDMEGFNELVRAVAAETQADPVFENLVHSFLGESLVVLCT